MQEVIELVFGKKGIFEEASHFDCKTFKILVIYNR